MTELPDEFKFTIRSRHLLRDNVTFTAKLTDTGWVISWNYEDEYGENHDYTEMEIMEFVTDGAWIIEED